MPKRKKPLSKELVAPAPRPQLALSRALQAVRAAAGAVLDLADAAAEALTKATSPPR